MDTPPRDIQILTDLAYETIPEDRKPLARLAHVHLLRAHGWKTQALAYLYRCSVEEINKLLAIPIAEKLSQEFGLPDFVVPHGFQRLEIPPDTLARLLELKPLARSPWKHPEETEEFILTLHRLIKVEGYKQLQIAEALGVTSAAIDARLMRYFYKKQKEKEAASIDISTRMKEQEQT